MQAIVAADRSWGIGKELGMLYELPADLKYFAVMTRGKVLVMGRRTFLSLPGGRPLKDRKHIILSRDEHYLAEGALVVHIDSCTEAYVTRIEAVKEADYYFPNLDDLPNWTLTEKSPVFENNGIEYTHCTYLNSQVQPIMKI